MIDTALICVLLSCILYGVIVLSRLRNFFKERNIKNLEPFYFFGNSLDSLLGKVHTWEVVDRLYKAYPDEDILGHFELMKPQFVARSREMVHRILVKDFSHFHDRVPADGKIESPVDASLFTLPGNIWRAVRNKLSPLFTAGKLKYMYHSISECGKNLETLLNKKNNQEVEMTDVMGLFTMDIIGSTAFGIEPNVLQNPDSKFREMGLKMFSGSLNQAIRVLFVTLLPRLSKALNIKGFIADEVNEYFFNIISSTIERREHDGTERNDFVQMLIQLKEKGKVEVQVQDSGDDYLMLDKISDTYELKVTDNILIGGAYSFLQAGFHSTAMTLAYALFHLAQEPQVVRRLREEISQTVEGEVPTYEEVKNMPYLEKVIKEVLRLHPSAPMLVRVCTKEYNAPGGQVFRPGDNIQIPAQSIHLDPAYWPDPERFDPERFEEPPSPGTFLPFGDGPRMCIAMRFAMMELKFGIASVVMKYDLKLSSKTKLPLKLVPRSFLAAPLGGITIRVSKR